MQICNKILNQQMKANSGIICKLIKLFSCNVPNWIIALLSGLVIGGGQSNWDWDSLYLKLHYYFSFCIKPGWINKRYIHILYKYNKYININNIIIILFIFVMWTKYCNLVDLLYFLLSLELSMQFSYFKNIHYFAWDIRPYLVYFEKVLA